MKTLLIWVVVITVVVIALQRCDIEGRKESDEPGVIETLTGALHIKTYRRAKSKLEDVDRKLERRYREIEE